MAIRDGGAAFPQHVMETRDGAFQCSYDAPDGAGMSLRDYFAAAALPGVLAARVALVNANLGTDLNQESVAEECYELADAMLAEREKCEQKQIGPAVEAAGPLTQE